MLIISDLKTRLSDLSISVFFCLGLSILAVAVTFGNEFVQLFFSSLLYHFKDVRCVLKNNYALMEISRPMSECSMCQDVSGPIVLLNEAEYTKKVSHHAYSSVPILIKGAARDWPAIKYFSFRFFAELYADVGPDAYSSSEEDCQFLPFKSEFISLHQAFHMKTEKSFVNRSPWYIGWSNCHPIIRQILRRYYYPTDFLPFGSESSALDWIFMGSPGPATAMHLDYVLRPSWQAQISGKKLWILSPPPECEYICSGFNITVEKGDVVFIDTNEWYHATFVIPDEDGLSISIGSEYD